MVGCVAFQNMKRYRRDSYASAFISGIIRRVIKYTWSTELDFYYFPTCTWYRAFFANLYFYKNVHKCRLSNISPGGKLLKRIVLGTPLINIKFLDACRAVLCKTSLAKVFKVQSRRQTNTHFCVAKRSIYCKVYHIHIPMQSIGELLSLAWDQFGVLIGIPGNPNTSNFHT